MGKHWQRVPRDVGGASSLETSKLRSGRALSHLICLKMSLLLAGHLVQMTSKGPCQAKPGEDSAGFACEKQRDWRLSEGGPTRKPLPRAAVSPAAAPHSPAAAPGQTSAAPRPAPGCTRGSPAAEPTGAWAPAAAGSRSAGSESEPAGKANTALCQLPSHPRVLTSTPASQPQSPGAVSSLAEMLLRAHFSMPTKKTNPDAATAIPTSK